MPGFKSITGHRRIHAAIACVMLATLAAPAQEQVQAEAGDGTAMEEQIRQSRERLENLVRERGLSEEKADALAAEIEAIRKDRATITAALIQAAKTEKKLAADIFDLEGRLVDLEKREDGIRASLWERRALLAEVLAALQRMGLNPPPAILVTPEDALSSVRSAILLSAVVPEMRENTDILLADLNELRRVTESIRQERTRLEETRTAQAEEQARLTLLVEEKRQIEGRTEEALAAERKRLEKLAGEAGSLESLIASLQVELDSARKAAEEAARAEAQAREQAANRLEEGRRRAEEQAAAPTRIAPSQPFASRSGQLARPVSGRTITAFGRDDGLGGQAQGDTIETSANAIVTAPADGWVLYAGPFRAYGNLLILDAGDEYHLVLAGMDRIDVAQGQFVLEGEPVGIMGSIRLAGVTAAAADNDNPTLYVEFRKNGKPVDPSPWWERISAGRT